MTRDHRTQFLALAAATVVIVALIGGVLLFFSRVTETASRSASSELSSESARSPDEAPLEHPSVDAREQLPAAGETLLPAQVATESTADVLSYRGPTPVFGRVVDSGRFPVAGIEVRLWMPQHAESIAITDERGVFRVSTSAPDPYHDRIGGVRALDPKNTRVGFARCSLWSAEALLFRGSGPNLDHGIDVGVLVLEPAASLPLAVICAADHHAVSVLAETVDGTPVGFAQLIPLPPARPQNTERGADHDGAHEAAPLPHAGSNVQFSVELSLLPARALLLRARTEPRAVAAALEFVTLGPGVNSGSRLELLPTLQLALCVVDADTAQPVPRVKVTCRHEDYSIYYPSVSWEPATVSESMSSDRVIPLWSEFETNALGEASVALPPNETCCLRLIAPGVDRPEVVSANGAEVLPSLARGVLLQLPPFGAPSCPPLEVRLKVRNTTSAAWRVQAVELPVPAPSTPIRIHAEHLFRADPDFPCAGRIVALPGSETLLMVENLGAVSCSLIGESEDGALVSLQRRESARPEPVSFRRPRSLRVNVRDARGAPVVGAGVVARTRTMLFRREPVLTDIEGVAELTGFYGGEVIVAALPPGVPSRRAELAFEGPQSIRVDLEKGDSRVDFTLGGGLTVECCFRDSRGESRLPTRYSLSWCSLPIDGNAQDETVNSVHQSEEDPSRGLVRFQASGPADHKFVLRGTAEHFLPFSAEQPIGSATQLRFDVTLAPAAALRVDVIPPVDLRYQVEVLAAKEPTKSAARPLPARKTAEHSLLFTNLEPGEYSVLDKWSQVEADLVELTAGSTRAITLDLSAAATLSGRVAVPAGYDASAALVEVHDSQQRVRTAQVGAQGDFCVRMAGASPVTLVAKHPMLNTSPSTGTATVTSASTDVLLVLEERGRLRFRIDASLEPIPKSATVVLTRAGSESPLDPRRVELRAGQGTAVVPVPGVYHVSVDLPEFPTCEFGPVVIESGLVDLGTIRPARGSALTVDFGGDDQRCSVHAECVHRPWVTRYYQGSGRSAVLRGLAKGSYEVSASIGNERYRWSVEMDGEADHTLSVTAR